MEYTIRSGDMVEIVRSYMDPGRAPARRRGLKVKKSSLKKIQANERNSGRRLARMIACNFDYGDLWVTLTEDGDGLPPSLPDAREKLAKWVKKAARAYRAKEGKSLKYIYAVGCRDSETGEPVRFHYHLILPKDAESYVTRYWPRRDDVTVRHMDGRRKYGKIAGYIVKNTTTKREQEAEEAGESIPGGFHRYQCSRNLKKPVYSEPVPVRLHDPVVIPKDARVDEKMIIQNEDLPVPTGVYVRYTKAREPSGKYQRLKI